VGGHRPPLQFGCFALSVTCWVHHDFTDQTVLPGEIRTSDLLLDVVDVLNELCIPYALAGALAASYYGIPRSTSDADSVVWLNDTGKTEGDLTNRRRPTREPGVAGRPRHGSGRSRPLRLRNTVGFLDPHHKLLKI